MKYQKAADTYGISRAQAVLTVRGEIAPPLTASPSDLMDRSLVVLGKYLDGLNKLDWKMVEARSMEKILFDQAFEDGFEERVGADKPGVEHAFSVALRMAFVNARWGLEPSASNIETLGSDRQTDIMAASVQRASYEIQNRQSLAERGYDFPYTGMFLIDNKLSREVVGVNLETWDQRLEMERQRIVARRVTTRRSLAIQGADTVGKAAAIGGGMYLMMSGITEGNLGMELVGLAAAVAGGLLVNRSTQLWENRWYTDFELDKLGADRRLEQIRVTDDKSTGLFE